jgi:hypothetical protein
MDAITHLFLCTHQALCLSFYLFHCRESLVFSNQDADVSESDTFDKKELNGNQKRKLNRIRPIGFVSRSENRNTNAI